MKIDWNTPITAQEPVDRSAKQVANTSASSTQEISSDRATLSTSGSSVKSLVSQALSTPEVRQDKVAWYKQQIAAGTYKPDPGRIAAGILAESAS